ncbi:MAG: TetR/AcrR family transcriptional regulator [Chloroflexi bacterium]|nr:TetR/AcrR family transcriptional regulator [Chloroflexota bacterium]
MSKDRRIRRTQKLLAEALVSLALEKGYKNITIQEVTERADIGYRTYFRHYAGLDELLMDVAQSRLDEIYEILNIPPADTELEDPILFFYDVGKNLFQHIQENQTNFRFLLLDNNLRFVLEPIMKRARERTEGILSSLPRRNISPNLAANHIIASAFSLMRWWLDNDMPHPPERMGEIFTNLIVQPTWLAMMQE